MKKYTIIQSSSLEIRDALINAMFQSGGPRIADKELIGTVSEWMQELSPKHPKGRIAPLSRSTFRSAIERIEKNNLSFTTIDLKDRSHTYAYYIVYIPDTLVTERVVTNTLRYIEKYNKMPDDLENIVL